MTLGSRPRSLIAFAAVATVVLLVLFFLESRQSTIVLSDVKKRLLLACPDRITCIACAFDRKTVAASGGDAIVNDFSIFVASVTNGLPTRQLHGHIDRVTGMEFVDNQTLFSCSADGSLRSWNSISGREQKHLVFPTETLTALCIVPKSDLLIVGSQNGILYVINRTSLEVVSRHSLHEIGVVGIYSLPTGGICSIARDGRIVITDRTLSQTQWVASLRAGTLFTALSPSRNKMALISYDFVDILDLQTKDTVYSTAASGNSRIFGWFMSDRVLAFNTGDDFCLVDFARKKSVFQCIIQEFVSAGVRLDETSAIVGSERGSLELWEFAKR